MHGVQSADLIEEAIHLLGNQNRELHPLRELAHSIYRDFFQEKKMKSEKSDNFSIRA